MAPLLSLNQQIIDRIYSFLQVEDVAKSSVVCKELKTKVDQIKLVNFIWSEQLVSDETTCSLVLPFIQKNRTIVIRPSIDVCRIDVSRMLYDLVIGSESLGKSDFRLYLVFDSESWPIAQVHYNKAFHNAYKALIQRGCDIRVSIESIVYNSTSLSVLHGYNMVYNIVHVGSFSFPDTCTYYNSPGEVCTKISRLQEEWPDVTYFTYVYIRGEIGNLHFRYWEQLRSYLCCLKRNCKFQVNYTISFVPVLHATEDFRITIEALEIAKEKNIKIFLSGALIIPDIVRRLRPSERVLMIEALFLIYEVCNEKTRIIIKDKVIYPISDKVTPDNIIKIASGELPVQETENAIYV